MPASFMSGLGYVRRALLALTLTACGAATQLEDLPFGSDAATSTHDAGRPSDAVAEADATAAEDTNDATDTATDAIERDVVTVIDSSPLTETGPADAVARDGGSVVVAFPSTGDTSHTLMTNYWNAGDFIEGVRVTALASVTAATIHIAVSPSSLTCDTQDMRLMINGVQVGTFKINPSATTIDASFSFVAIPGPTYRLRYETTRTVTSGCGSAGFAIPGGTVTLF